MAFTLTVFGPIVLRAVSPERQGFAHEAITITGLLAFSFTACAVVLPSRVKSLTQNLGIESVLSSHRYLGTCAALMAVAHLAAVLIADPQAVNLINPLVGPWRALMGMLALLALAGIAIAARYRTGGRYEAWRWAHIGLALVALVTVTSHIILIRHLILQPVAGVLLGLIALGVLAALVNRWIIAPYDSGARFVVARLHEEAPGVTTVSLRPLSGRHAAYQYRAGQFAWLRLEASPLAEEHPFTISSAEQDGTRPQFTIRHSGDWTRDTLSRLRVGDRVWLHGPYGQMTPQAGGHGLVMIAAGVGLTPMISILRTLARGMDTRPILLFVMERRGEALFRDELERLGEVLNLTVEVLSDRRISADALAARLPRGRDVREGLEYFVCGSPRLVRDARNALDELAIPPARVKSELFDAS